MVILVLLFIVCLMVACGFGMYKSRKKMESVPLNPYIGVLTDSATLGQMAQRSRPNNQQFPDQFHQSSTHNGRAFTQLGFNMNHQQQFLTAPSSGQVIDPVDQFSLPVQILPANQSRRLGQQPQVTFDPRTTVFNGTGKNGRNRSSQRTIVAQPQPPAAPVVAPNTEYLGPHQDMDRGVMGSSEAEFQNDFIEVFPMRHLEPKPDLE